MKIYALLPASAALTAAFASFLGTRPADEVDPRDIVDRAKVSLVQILANAQKACPGSAVEAELEGELENGKLEVFFEVMVVGDDGKLHELKFDPASGQLTENEDVSGEEDGKELAAFRAVLRQSELHLADLIGKAAAIVNGTPIKAALELEHGNPGCDVKIVNGRYLIEAEMEARAGHLIGLELEGDEVEEHGDGDHGEYRGHDEHGEKGEHADHGKKGGGMEEEEEEEEGEEHEGHEGQHGGERHGD